MTERSLALFLRIASVLPITTGVVGAVCGAKVIPHSGTVDPSVTSDLRFVSIWWFGAGLYLLSLSHRLPTATRELRLFCGVLFAGGLARWLGVLVDGTPHPLFVALAVAEVTIAPLVVLWHNHIQRKPHAIDV